MAKKNAKISKKLIPETNKDKPSKKVGRPKDIESPEKLLEYFQEYKKSTKGNPFTVTDWVGKDADKVERPKEKPLTIEGFECYLYDQDIIGDLGDYFSNKDGRYSEFTTICSRIKKEVRSDQIAGGMAGIYNPSITQRLNGLVEKSETDIKINKPVIIDWGNDSPKTDS